MGGIAPVRQSDRLVGFTAEARARRYLAPRPARNAVTPLPHIPWRLHPYVRSSSVGLNARLAPLLLPTPQRRVRHFRYWHFSDPTVSQNARDNDKQEHQAADHTGNAQEEGNDAPPLLKQFTNEHHSGTDSEHANK